MVWYNIHYVVVIGGESGGGGVRDMGCMSALRQPTNGDRCVTFAPGTSADIDSGPFQRFDITNHQTSRKTDGY